MKYGFIGCGNMGGALARALAKTTTDILISDPAPLAAAVAKELGCAQGSNREVIRGCERFFLGVKPQMVASVLADLQADLQENKPVLITMAAGVTIGQILAYAGTELPVIRIFPNTPVAVGSGLVLYHANELVTPEVLASFLADMAPAGRLVECEEYLLDSAGTVSACGPAYFYMLVEAMADGAVACGVPRAKAIEFAAATMAGAAQMVLQSGKHPGELKDMVCSPAGSTIAGVKVLEENRFRGTVMDCIVAACEKNRALGK